MQRRETTRKSPRSSDGPWTPDRVLSSTPLLHLAPKNLTGLRGLIQKPADPKLQREAERTIKPKAREALVMPVVPRRPGEPRRRTQF